MVPVVALVLSWICTVEGEDAGTVRTLAGRTGTSSSADGFGTSATFASPSGISVVGSGSWALIVSRGGDFKSSTERGPNYCLARPILYWSGEVRILLLWTLPNISRYFISG